MTNEYLHDGAPVFHVSDPNMCFCVSRWFVTDKETQEYDNAFRPYSHIFTIIIIIIDVIGIVMILSLASLFTLIMILSLFLFYCYYHYHIIIVVVIVTFNFLGIIILSLYPLCCFSCYRPFQIHYHHLC